MDPEVILETSHGRRSIDVLKEVEPSKANWECKSLDPNLSHLSLHSHRGADPTNQASDISHMESLIPLRYGSSAVEIPGARSLLSSLTTLASPWAIVTSGTMPLVTGWLTILKLPRPEHLVAAEDVENGKPDPGGYLMGLKKLGLEGSAADVLVLEDSPAGIRAGKAAGCRVLGVVTSQ